ncbi:hypothetical protein TWF718_001547 [Orbilia javanica]|uniref:Uncharacterized protein n=1 Tax=Orbilia javanica TaxID=47235 RepID=A0AAN8RH73_9PEZI
MSGNSAGRTPRARNTPVPTLASQRSNRRTTSFADLENDPGGSNMLFETIGLQSPTRTRRTPGRDAPPATNATPPSPEPNAAEPQATTGWAPAGFLEQLGAAPPVQGMSFEERHREATELGGYLQRLREVPVTDHNEEFTRIYEAMTNRLRDLFMNTAPPPSPPPPPPADQPQGQTSTDQPTDQSSTGQQASTDQPTDQPSTGQPQGQTSTDQTDRPTIYWPAGIY